MTNVVTLTTRAQQIANIADLLRKQVEWFIADPSTDNAYFLQVLAESYVAMQSTARNL